MGQVLSRKLYRSTDKFVGFYCPGCGDMHFADITRWKWNNNINQPTFTPSLNIHIGHYAFGQPQPPNCEHCNEAKEDGHETLCGICHFNLIDGKIRYCQDTTHRFSNQTIDMVDLPQHYLDKLKS